MSNVDLKRLALARDIEDAFKNYLGTDSFPTEEWPAVALAIADVIVGTQGVDSFDNSANEIGRNAVELVRRMARLDNAIADLMGL